MKHFTRFFSLLLILTLLLSACGKSGEKTLADGSGISNEDGIDLDDIAIRVCGDIGDDSSTFLSFDKARTLSDTIRSRFSEVADEYNCHFIQTKDITTIEQVVLSTAVGNSPVDFFVEFIFYGGDEFKNGVLIPMSYVSDYIDIHDSFRWGNPNNLEIFARDGELYGVYPASWPETNIMSTDFLLVYNSELLTKELNLEDPRQFYEQKKWKPDLFVDYVKNCTIQRGGDEDPIYGLSAYERHLVDMSLKAFGAYPAHRAEDGTWIKGYSNNEGINALTFAARFMPKGDLNEFVKIQGVAESSRFWANTGCTFCLLHSNYTFSQAGTDSSNLVTTCGIKYGLMPFPSESGELIAQYERCINAIAIPETAEDPDTSAMLINDLFAPLPGFETEEDLITYYTNNIVFSEKDASLIVNLTKNSRYLFHDEGFNTDHLELVTLLEQQKGALVSIERRNNKILERVEKSVIPAYETIEEIFGYQY